jgi:hypothetical protein
MPNPEQRLVGIAVHDRRAEPRPPRDARGAPKPAREWPSIFGACVHQTASGHLDADHPRLLSIPAPIIIHGDASVTLLHDLELRMEHGHALNGPTIGIEVDCRADGIEGDARTFWRSKEEETGFRVDKQGKRRWVGIKTREMIRREATDGQIDTLRSVLLFCWETWLQHATDSQRPHWGVYTHRQGHRSRTSDPGSRISRACAELSKAIAWKDVSREKYGSGRPWPDAWTGENRGVKY